MILWTTMIVLFITGSIWGEVLSPEDVLKMKTCGNVTISPDGKYVAYTISVPRTATDKPGGAYAELHVLSTKTGKSRGYITGKVNVSSIAWSPDGSKITFRTRRENNKATQVWAIPVAGGEATQVTHSPTSVLFYRWRPDGKKIAYIATTPQSKREKILKKKGYDFIYFEENLKHRNIYLACASCADCIPEQLTEGVTVWDFEFNPDGSTIAASISPKNLIDQRYMFRDIYLLNVETQKLTMLVDIPGKVGNYAFSPDGTMLVYNAASEQKDHGLDLALVIPVTGGESKDLTPPKFFGHINWVGWKDNKTVVYKAGEGVWPTLSTVPAKGGNRKVILNSKDSGVIFGTPSFTKGLKNFAFSCNTPTHPNEVYTWQPGKKMEKRTDVNPWMAERELGEQAVIHYDARDGLDIEGLLIYPVGYEKGTTVPLIVTVHGGPESHFSNGWNTGYNRQGQILAGRGYAVFYPNYRTSTGYGPERPLMGFNDPAGSEFDDIADGIEYLIAEGIADRDRVGLGGGSYGGYASAWFSSYYTKYIKAVCMFVGITNKISMQGTTDIPYEMLYVHFGELLEDRWDMALKRSPIYYAHQSKTAVLIMGGNADTRVHPEQSLEYYRRLKMNNHPAVRLVQYPGEGHGNRKQVGRIDLLYRSLAWYDWYVKDLKPLDGPMPPLDISDQYGLDLE